MQQFDAIIVGAGAAGGIVAGVLAEAGWRVLGAAAAELGWSRYPRPWAPVLAAAGSPVALLIAGNSFEGSQGTELSLPFG